MVVPNSVYPLLNDIRELQENRESGVLSLTKLDHRVSVYHREGIIQSAASNLVSHRIGGYLIRDEYMSEADVPRILTEARREKILFGEAAVRREFLKHAFKNGFARESFTRCLRSNSISANINVACVLLELSRANPTPFERDPATVFALKNGEDLSGVPWYPKEICVLGGLNGPVTFPALQDSTGIDEASLRRILGVFERLGIIETIGEGLESTGVPSNGQTALVKQKVLPYERLVPIVTNAVPGERLEVLRNPSSFITEQFKALKVHVRGDCETPHCVLTVTSPDAQDGKSLVSANLAVALSMESGRRTVIVDCDFRNPTVNKHLGVAIGPGLIQYLSSSRMSPYCFMRRLGNLFLVTTGGIAENPVELLSLRKMKEFVERLRMDFDTVILDTPPLSPIADARIVSGLSDNVIVVIRRGSTSIRSIENAFRVVDQSKLLGVVFNDVKPLMFNTCFSRGYYSYGVDNTYSYSGNRKPAARPKNYLGA